MRTLFLTSLLCFAMPMVAGCALSTPEPTDDTAHAVGTPPPVCSDGLVTRTQGFWKNHTCVLKGEATGFSLVPQTLGSTLVLDKPADVEAYFNLHPQGDKQIIMGHQLLAAKLNVAAFDIGDIAFADWDADGTLETVNELIAIGDALFDSGSAADRVKAATIFDKLNNDGHNEDLWFDPTCHDAPADCD
jgi:hypothetical protein